MSVGDKVNTNTMLRQLFRTNNLDLYFRNYEDEMQAPDFCRLLKELCLEKKLSPAQVIDQSQIERTYGHQLFNGTRSPSRDKVLQLALGAGLSVPDTQKLLRAAGKSPLYPKLKRDAVILFGLQKGYSILAVQDALSAYGLTILGGQKNG